jgi:CRP/FNR family transcriptional regulator
MSTTGQSSEIFFHSKFFRGLSSQELQPLADICQRKKIQSGQYLVRQNDPAAYVYTLISGAMMIERTAKSGRRQVIGFSYPGDFIGFTTTDEFEYCVVCLQESRLQMFPRGKFLELVDKNPILKENARNTGRGLFTQALDQLFALGQKKAHERLCFLIHQIARRQPGSDPDHVDLIMNRQDIADYLGLTIETVSRSFAKLKKDGTIDIESAHRVTILDRETLEEMASAC